jgi:hypothetical protein
MNDKALSYSYLVASAPRIKWTIWINGLLRGDVLAANEGTAEHVARDRWRVGLNARVVAKPKYPDRMSAAHQHPGADEKLEASTPIDALVLKIARVMLGWNATTSHSRLGVTQPQRENMEAGRASGEVKARIFHALRAEGIDIEGLSRLASDFLEYRKSGPPRRQSGPHA